MIPKTAAGNIEMVLELHKNGLLCKCKRWKTVKIDEDQQMKWICRFCKAINPAGSGVCHNCQRLGIE